MAAALAVVDEHAEINHRYRKLLHDSQQLLASEEIRLTQARGIAKKLMVLVKAAGPGFRGELSVAEDTAVTAGLDQARELVYDRD